jgi:hypothetical protein
VLSRQTTATICRNIFGKLLQRHSESISFANAVATAASKSNVAALKSAIAAAEK